MLAPCKQRLSFAYCLILVYSRKTLHELSKIFVKHALHVAGIYFLNPGLMALRLVQRVQLWPGFGLALGKTSCQERTRLSCPEVCAAVTSKACQSKSGKASFSSHHSRRQKEASAHMVVRGQLELNIVHNTGFLIWKLFITSRVK